jgi:hypothetical protein
MKGIYLTLKAKQEIENKIVELEKDRQHWLNITVKNIGNPNYNSLMDSINQVKAEQAISLLQEILSSATILPVEESWKLIGENTGTFYDDDGEILHSHFKNGVIIQPKK